MHWLPKEGTCEHNLLCLRGTGHEHLLTDTAKEIRSNKPNWAARSIRQRFIKAGDPHACSDWMDHWDLVEDRSSVRISICENGTWGHASYRHRFWDEKTVDREFVFAIHWISTSRNSAGFHGSLGHEQR